MHADAHFKKPALKSRAEVESVLENLAHLHADLDVLTAQRDNELEAVRRRHQSAIDKIISLIQEETGWVWAWADANPLELGCARRLECAAGVIGYTQQPVTLDRASRRWTWCRVVEALRATTWGGKYLKTPEPVVDKDAILAHLPQIDPQALREVGIKVVRGDRFFITPKPAAKETPSP